jgi:ceramide glucosyltransferase
MIFIFYFFAALLVYLSYKSFRGGIDYLNYFRSELAKPTSNYTPFASIIVPCRGLDQGLEKNLYAILEQDYPEYEVIFVVDDECDLAVEVINKCKYSEWGKKSKLVVAPRATESSQKVENLREGVLHVSEKSQAFVFADSDARPSRDWLRRLVAPLEDENIGAASGYRWFISESPDFPSELRSAWNASIASALGRNSNRNFCWGGATAVRRKTFGRLNILERWRGTLSDDFTVTRVMNEAALSIHFVPQALTASIENCTFRELFEFTTRQMKVTRVYAPKLWMLSFFGSALFTLVMLAAVLIVTFGSWNGLPVWAAFSTLNLVTFFSIGKSWMRLKAVRMALPDHNQALRRQVLPQCVFWLISQPLFLYNCFAAALSRRMTWRGTRYELVSADETKTLN